MKKGLAILFGFFLCTIFVSVTFAAPERPDRRYDKINDTCREFKFQYMRDGARIFKDVCKSCHNENYNSGLRPMTAFVPRSYSPGQWTRFLNGEKTPQCSKDGAWSSLSEDELLKLNDYLYRGGYGTWNTCTELEFC